jgi:hypothetical protein
MSAVGKPVFQERERDVVEFVNDWESASAIMITQETECFLIESQNTLYDCIWPAQQATHGIKRAAQEFNAWIDRLRQSVQPIVDLALKSVPPAYHLAYQPTLSWLLMKSMVVAQFDGAVPTDCMYRRITSLFIAGRCVCGWKGDYPAGRLVVY